MSFGAAPAIISELDRAAELISGVQAWPFGRVQDVLPDASTSSRLHDRPGHVVMCPRSEGVTFRANLQVCDGYMVFTSGLADYTSSNGTVWGAGFAVSGSIGMRQGMVVIGSSAAGVCLALNRADATTSCNVVHVVTVAEHDSAAARTYQTEAARLIAKGMSLAGLTQEQFAPLLAVTRRSLYNWQAGEAISARKELRLRGLVDALTALSEASANNVDVTRTRLYDRSPGGLRPYDLIAEGRFDVAVQLATNRPSPAHVKPIALPAIPPPPAPVLARLSLREDVAIEPHGRVDLRRSRRLKR